MARIEGVSKSQAGPIVKLVYRFGPRMIEEQWGEVLKAKKLFPLRAVLKFENGPERFRFEVQSVTPEKIKKEDEAKLFQPPTDYQEIQPLAF